MKNIYYPKYITKAFEASLSVTAFLIISISIITNPVTCRAEENFDQSAKIYQDKGYDEQQRGNYDRALTFYLKAEGMGYNSAALFNDIGIVYEQLGVIPQAEHYYRKAINTDPNYLSPYTNLAYMYKAKGEKEKAIRYFMERFERSESNDPWRDKVWQEITSLDPSYEQKRVEQEASKLYQELVRKSRDEFALNVLRSEKHYQQGMLLHEEKDYDGAMDEFERALALTPENPKITKALKQTLYDKEIDAIKLRIKVAVDQLDKGEVQAAKKEFQKILTIIPNKSNQIE